MARIRSIKPDFWVDGKTRRLSDTTALFFIALWNHCDDSGFFELDTLELSMKVARWRSQDIMRMLRALHGAGMVQLSTGDGVGMVTSWHHQKIDKPRSSKWKDKLIQWDAKDDSTNGIESSAIIRRKDRIGKDRIGKDRISTRKPKAPAASPPAEAALAAPTNSNLFIARYCEHWKAKYGSNPPIVGKDGGIAKRLAKVGESRLFELLDAYFLMPDAYVIKAKHPLELFESKLKEIAAFADSGEFITRRQASQYDDIASNALLLQQVQRGEL